MSHNPILVLIGPTASGKSALAMELAQKRGGVIINADAMQCYADLRVITARPTQAEEARLPHRLYGVWPWQFHGHAAAWREAAIGAIQEALGQGRLPILVGGSGMYLKTLMEGIAPVPEIGEEVRQRFRPLSPRRMPGSGCRHEDGMTHLYELLQTKDPLMAARLKPNDTQRIIRALEVFEQTGKSLSLWQEESLPLPFPPAAYRCFRIAIPREVLYARINARFEQMMQQGALEEAQAMMRLCDDANREKRIIASSRFASSPLLKAHGLPELMAYLRGEMGLEQAIARAQQHTRNYAKRQLTWERHQMAHAVPLPYDDRHAALKAVDLALKDG